MTMLVKAVLDVWVVAVVLSLAAIVTFLAAAAAASLSTVVSAHRGSRLPAYPLTGMARWSSAGDLAKMDRELDRIWARETGPAPSRRGR